MSELVRVLENRYLPRLNCLASDLVRDFPALKCHAFSVPVGTLTSYQGHTIGVECLFPEPVKDGADNLALSIDLGHLDASPHVMADVVWGHPSGYVEAELENWSTEDDWPPVTPDSLERLNEAFDGLSRVFVEAIRSSQSAG